MNLHKRILTHNDCYRKGRHIKPRGVMVHSTGSNNPYIGRYVDAPGLNPSSRHWNQSGVGACVHAFIGKRPDGSVATYKTLPWDCRGWHCAGSGNNTHISFEICEDGLSDPGYFRAVYREAVELTAYLCGLYDLDPLEDGVVICHSEGNKRGIASNHADVMHWFPQYGKSMDTFRKDVAEEMKGFTQKDFDHMMDDYLTRRLDLPESPWGSKARKWVKEKGVLSGDNQGRMMWQGLVTREQLAAALYNLFGKE